MRVVKETWKERLSVLVTIFDSLHQAECLRDDQARTPTLAPQNRLPVGPLRDVPIDDAAIASSVQFALACPLGRADHHLRNKVLAGWAGSDPLRPVGQVPLFLHKRPEIIDFDLAHMILTPTQVDNSGRPASRTQ